MAHKANINIYKPTIDGEIIDVLVEDRTKKNMISEPLKYGPQVVIQVIFIDFGNSYYETNGSHF